MKLETLQKIRFAFPIALSTFAAIPGVFFLNFSAPQQENALKWIIPLIAAVIGAAYSAMNLRGWHWNAEQNAFVGKQVRLAFLKMVPDLLSVTDEEKKELYQRSIWKKLSGVFWEAIDGDAELTVQKEFFYANGAYYTAAIDTYLILPFFALAYIAAFLMGFGFVHLLFASACIFISLFAKHVVVPIRRRHHLELSAEQLDSIEQRRRDFVQERFSAIITTWRQSKQSD
jgi:hypothetical protein